MRNASDRIGYVLIGQAPVIAGGGDMRLVQRDAHALDAERRGAEIALADGRRDPLENEMSEKLGGGVASLELRLVVEVAIVHAGQDLAQHLGGEQQYVAAGPAFGLLLAHQSGWILPGGEHGVVQGTPGGGVGGYGAAHRVRELAVRLGVQGVRRWSLWTRADRRWARARRSSYDPALDANLGIEHQTLASLEPGASMAFRHYSSIQRRSMLVTRRLSRQALR